MCNGFSYILYDKGYTHINVYVDVFMCIKLLTIKKTKVSCEK